MPINTTRISRILTFFLAAFASASKEKFTLDEFNKHCPHPTELHFLPNSDDPNSSGKIATPGFLTLPPRHNYIRPKNIDNLNASPRFVKTPKGDSYGGFFNPNGRYDTDKLHCQYEFHGLFTNGVAVIMIRNDNDIAEKVPAGRPEL